jgi:hypothetical protein
MSATSNFIAGMGLFHLWCSTGGIGIYADGRASQLAMLSACLGYSKGRKAMYELELSPL